MKKPLIRHGRFYNESSDSIFVRLKDVIRVTRQVAVQKLQGKRTSEKLLMVDEFVNPWIMTQEIIQPTLHPVVTWIGHATFLIQVAGVTIMTDPIFFDSSRFMKRIMPLPSKLEALPPVDIVLISHNHRDHLDERSMMYLKQYQPVVCVPLGDEAWFLDRDFHNVYGHEWGEQRKVKDVTFTFLPASHWSGRGLRDINRSLWGSWMLSVGGFTLYFAGDTAYTEHFKAIGQQFPSIDVALLPIGPEEPRDLMKESHLNSLEAIQAFIDLGAHQFIPMHWGTFAFGLDTFTLPIERLKTSWIEHEKHLEGKKLLLPRCGQAMQFAFEYE